MIIPIPSGTRDVLPDEMRELRAISSALRDTFEAAGYGELQTPALEYESVLQLAGTGEALPAYRVFDEHGEVLALRSDMTVPIARVVASRFAQAQPPLRFSYLANAYRSVRPHRGQMREFQQAGVELVGLPGAAGTAEVLAVMCRALDATGLRGYRVGLGSAALYPDLLRALELPADLADALLAALSRHDYVALAAEVERHGLPDALVELPQLRGGPEVLDAVAGPLADAVSGLREVLDLLEPAVAERVILDLGLSRRLGYYTGAIFEVYDPALGEPIGGGGRYDELLGRFGLPLPAAGFALGVDSLHIALAGEERTAS